VAVDESRNDDRIGTIEPKTGMTQYFASLTPGAWKTFCNAEQNFWCCTGSGGEASACALSSASDIPRCSNSW